MKTTLVFLSFAVALSQCFSQRSEWNLYKKHYEKIYSSDAEENFRMEVFRDNLEKINHHNKRYEQGLVSFKMQINEFGDLLSHEFLAMFNGFNNSADLGTSFPGATFISPFDVQLPKVRDWRNEGAVTPVKNQGYCGSCWAFSAVGSIEGQHYRLTGDLVSLSEQNLVDCSSDYGNYGCDGGLMTNAFQYVMDNDGLDTEASYPYSGSEGNCRYDSGNSGATVTGFVEIESGNEDQLMEAVATVGPVSVAIDASLQSFQFYSSGVYYEPECSSFDLNHAVLAVGYGTEGGEDYWLIKNSWGSAWGDEGYVKMARNRDNNCGVASVASFPLV